MRFIIISNARCGTTYVSKALSQFSQQVSGYNSNLNELFRFYGPLDYITDNNNRITFRQPKHNEDYESTLEEKEARNYRFNKILREHPINFTLKIHTSQFDSNLKLKDSIMDIDKLFDNKDTFPILLYREDQLDRFISKLYAQVMDKYNLHHFDKRPNLKDLNASYDRTRDMGNLIDYAKTCKLLRELYHTYKWSLVIRYEDLCGDPVKDFGHMFKNRVTPITNITKKLGSKEDKRKNLHNFDMLRHDFDMVSQYYGIERYMSLPKFDKSKVDFTKNKPYLI